MAYKSLLKVDLLKLCEEKGIKCPTRLKKDEIIAILEASGTKKKVTSPLTKKAPAPKAVSTKNKVTKTLTTKKVPPPKKPSIIPQIHLIKLYIGMGKSVDDQIESQRAHNIKSALEEYLKSYDWSGAEKLKQEVAALVSRPKPSIIPNLFEVRDLVSSVKSGKNTRIVRELKEYLLIYNWDGAEDIKKAVEKIVSTAPSSGYKRPVAKKSPVDKKVVAKKSPADEKVVKKRNTVSRYVPGVYKPVEIMSVSFGKKGEEPPKKSKKPVRIAITLEELRKEVDNPEFIKRFTQSSRDLMAAKEVFYKKRYEDAKKEYETVKLKVEKLQRAGISSKTIDDMYPNYPTMAAFMIDLEGLAQLVKKKGETVTEEEIKEGLIYAIDDVDDGISSLIGRTEIKNQLASQLYSFSKGYRTFIGSFNNISIYGGAGLGKSRLAQVIGYAFSKAGILATDNVKIVTRTELIGQYIGQTAPKTRSVLLQTLEGVLFIDEAYQLTQCPEDKVGSKDFGSESVTEIVNFLDKYIGMSIVIVAGYEGVMTRCFMAFNEGLPRRFPYRYILSPYPDEELTDILISNLKRKIPADIKIDDDTSNFLYSMVVKIRTELPDAFKNQAGDMLNLSAYLNKAITSSFKIKWQNGKLANNIPILLSGFDDFLGTKGYSVYD